MEPQNRYYYNCSVDGCLNSTLNGKLSFFNLPVVSERFRKLRRIVGVRQIKFAGLVLTVTLFMTVFMYYWYHLVVPPSRHKVRPRVRHTTYKSIRVTNIPMKHIPLNEIYDYTADDDRSIEFEERQQRFMVNTPGCQIPVAMVRYEKNLPNNEISCGKRAVFIRKHDDNHVSVRIKYKIMKIYLKNTTKFYCCYRFIKRSSSKGHEHTGIEYTNCQVIQDGETFKLITDFINVKCYEFDKRNQTVIIYNDVYAFAKKIDTQEVHNTYNETKYNVLMIGMDSMSLSRVSQTMPRTIGFFKDNFWLGFRGYHKVEDNTFPNLMAAFTGYNYSTISEMCSETMDYCNDLMIWSRFKKSGYVTAYGEDYLHLPDTFKKNFVFRHPPTDHYLRTFFLHGEIGYYKGNYSIVCNEHAPSGQHLLDFAVDFATTYRSSSFFGVFWMNSYSHDTRHHPQYADRIFENFFNQLTYTGVLENTFIIFFSDHGVRFGKYRLLGESYYDERMPAFFMWVPTRFKGQQSMLYRSAVANEFKLLTPYDLYNTLVSIHGISNSIKNYTQDFSKDCQKCHSIFEVVSVNRTCEDVEIHMKWCSCHRLYPLEVHDSEGIKSVLHVVSHVKSMVQNTKTKPCWYCQNLSLKTIVRIHFYYIHLNLYYVVAFSMNPGNIMFEATVSRKAAIMELVGPVSVIEAYKGKSCTINNNDRYFCVCRKKKKC